jgi:DNA-binding IclR family transcriptional regulator
MFNQRLLCALSVAGPSVRFGDERVAEIVALVRAEADQLGRALSASGGGS